jgi:hypothetical protein
MLTKQLRELERQATVVPKRREIVIKFEDVKNYIKIFSNHYNDEIVSACEPFAMDYILSPFGFAETDNLNNIDEIISNIENGFWMISLENKTKQKQLIKHAVKTETERWKERNAWGYGRMIGRLAYLINEQKRNRKDYWIRLVEKLDK